MDDQLKQDFTRRLSQCNAGGMIVIIYDILFAYLDDARHAYGEQEHENFKEAVRKSQNVLDELLHSLNFAYDISRNLQSLYVYCKNALATALYQNRLDELENGERILRQLYGAFVQAAKQDTSGPLMSNTQQVYAGMTYGRGELNENYINDQERGFFV